MDDITKIILTSSLTIFGSALVLVFGQIIIRFIIEPIHDFKKILGEIQYALSFHARAIQTPIGKKEAEDKAQEALRKLSCDLRSKIGAIPLYRFWSSILYKFLLSKKNALVAARHLMYLSNAVRNEDRSKNSDVSNKISPLLNLDIDE